MFKSNTTKCSARLRGKAPGDIWVRYVKTQSIMAQRWPWGNQIAVKTYINEF